MFHTPMIKFIGKRSLVGHHDTPAQTIPPVFVAAVAPAAAAHGKALSFGATVEYADAPAKRWGRLAMSAEEQ